MQRKAAGDLRKSVTDALVDAGLTYEAAREYWTPRRLTLDIRGLTPRSKDVHEEIKGPSTKAPEQALAGFMRKAGLSDISEAHVHTDPKKGDFYVAHISKPGRDAEEIIADVMPGIIRGFSWPKSMRWGPASAAKPGGIAQMGAAAAIDHLHLRSGNRRADRHRFRDRRSGRRQHHLGSPLPRARQLHRAPLR
jgi:glycyl-tRNA synthetase beta chain